MSRGLVASQALDAATFALFAAFLPVALYEVNPVSRWIVLTLGVWAFVALKVALGLGAAAVWNRAKPAPWLRVAFGAAVVLTFAAAGANLVALAQGLA